MNYSYNLLMSASIVLKDAENCTSTSSLCDFLNSIDVPGLWTGPQLIFHHLCIMNLLNLWMINPFKVRHLVFKFLSVSLLLEDTFFAISWLATL